MKNDTVSLQNRAGNSKPATATTVYRFKRGRERERLEVESPTGAPTMLLVRSTAVVFAGYPGMRRNEVLVQKFGMNYNTLPYIRESLG
ncbi:uncharacterized protein LOC104878988 isoform X3 [Vitis vinifera]|uniref:uncharacterized protein LOC104878988 isoform X3 n=1 Tax=Vitis vinifera TaxID=29760 RepID=UPI00053FB5FB|nr:uncharacterized protein LOC104878988 isoform X3 [Vitis vinifera]|eukprot:XP_010648381.1 PREDICTED: uncharacterized protein LOC104878988 isoform X3 [Vitis vinifera]